MSNSPDRTPVVYTLHLYCTIVDNFGDIGVCWRLARQLAAEYGHTVHLWVDDWPATRRMILDLPEIPTECWVEEVCIHAWAQTSSEADCTGDVLIEGFGCTLPDVVLAQLAGRVIKPVWINLEYFSAEPWVPGFHAQSGYDPAVGTRRWFFFPGVHAHSGGLLRERDLIAQRDAWQHGDLLPNLLEAFGLPTQAAGSALTVLCFGYAHAPYAAWLAALCQRADQPVSVWLCGAYTQAAVLPLAASLCRQVNVHALPFVPQPDFDHLLWSADVLFVRGEDSLIRALWAGKPFVWQIYPQSEQAHHVKLQAWLDFYTQGFPVALRTAYTALHEAWNGMSEQSIKGVWGQLMADWADWQQYSRTRSEQCAALPDLASRLMGFVGGL